MGVCVCVCISKKKPYFYPLSCSIRGLQIQLTKNKLTREKTGFHSSKYVHGSSHKIVTQRGG